MRVTKRKINNISKKEVFLLKFENDNNYYLEFSNYVGSFFSIKIDY